MKKGFSLIELLVVISIMAILIGMSAFGLQQARESARDSQRKSDLETLRTGLSMYKSDCNSYPVNAGNDFKTEYGSSFSGTVGACGVANTYISKTPSDPISGRSYHYISDGTTYTICSYLESGDTTTATGCPSASGSCGGTCNYAVYNP